MTHLSQTDLYKLLEPGAEALGFELLAIELGGHEGNTVLRAYIDGPDGVGVDDCADVSHQLSAILDVEDPIPGQYTLEVSSPGLDRPLTKPEHFRNVLGHRVRVETGLPIEGRRRFKGVLSDASEETLRMEIDGQTHHIPLASVVKARLMSDQ